MSNFLEYGNGSESRTRHLRKIIAEQAEIISDYINGDGQSSQFVELHAHHILAALHEMKRMSSRQDCDLYDCGCVSANGCGDLK